MKTHTKVKIIDFDYNNDTVVCPRDAYVKISDIVIMHEMSYSNCGITKERFDKITKGVKYFLVALDSGVRIVIDEEEYIKTVRNLEHDFRGDGEDLE